MTQEDLAAFNQAISLASSNPAAAYQQLKHLELRNHSDVNLLAWLVFTAPGYAEKQYWVNRAKVVNPENATIQQAMQWFAQQAAPPQTASSNQTPEPLQLANIYSTDSNANARDSISYNNNATSANHRTKNRNPSARSANWSQRIYSGNTPPPESVWKSLGVLVINTVMFFFVLFIILAVVGSVLGSGSSKVTESPAQLSSQGNLTYQAPGCTIKGNVSIDSGEKIYHVPGQRDYDSTKIDPQYGERWFCNESDAARNGWRKAGR